MKLIEATPTSVHPSGTLGFCFTFGERIIGQHVGSRLNHLHRQQAATEAEYRQTRPTAMLGASGF